MVRLQLRAGRPWTKAKVLRKVGIRSYKVVTESGAEFRRNRRALKKTNENFEDDDIPFRDERDERENNRARQHDHENIRVKQQTFAEARDDARSHHTLRIMWLFEKTKYLPCQWTLDSQVTHV